MNNSIFKQIMLLLTIALITISCDRNDTNYEYNIVGHWKVIAFYDYGNSIKTIKLSENTWMDFNNGDNTITFIPSDDTKGSVYGINVTNAFSGNYSVDSKGIIFIENHISTYVNEPEWGRLFHAIEYVEEYVIEKNVLIMFYNNKKNSITLERIGN